MVCPPVSQKVRSAAGLCPAINKTKFSTQNHLQPFIKLSVGTNQILLLFEDFDYPETEATLHRTVQDDFKEKYLTFESSKDALRDPNVRDKTRYTTPPTVATWPHVDELSYNSQVPRRQSIRLNNWPCLDWGNNRIIIGNQREKKAKLWKSWVWIDVSCQLGTVNSNDREE